jgi:hypothetical protein
MCDHKIFVRQYSASLEMLAQAVNRCPDAVWLDSNCTNRFWHIAYHAVFYTHLYLQASESAFKRWHKHRLNYQFLGAVPWPPFEKPVIDTPYSRDEILDYREFCLAELEEDVRGVDMDAPSGFPWLPFSRLELHIYNIRHIQHHTGQLIDRLRRECNIDVSWISGR